MTTGKLTRSATSDVQIFREPPSRLRVPCQSDRGRSPSVSCLMHDRPFRGAPQPSDEPWRRFHDAQLPCYARLLPCRCPLESIFRLFKPHASYEPFIGSSPKSVIAVEGLSIQWVPVRGVVRTTLMRHPSGA